ncbi:MAG: hypothetical protein PHF70_10235 [Opitutales bacterium]|nr:hypothetical protein [Opitutales bacterium]
MIKTVAFLWLSPFEEEFFTTKREEHKWGIGGSCSRSAKREISGFREFGLEKSISHRAKELYSHCRLLVSLVNSEGLKKQNINTG